jgi:hypothetical protein
MPHGSGGHCHFESQDAYRVKDEGTHHDMGLTFEPDFSKIILIDIVFAESAAESTNRCLEGCKRIILGAAAEDQSVR